MTIDQIIVALEKATEGSAALDAEMYLACEAQLSRRVQEGWNRPIPLDMYALTAVEWHGFQFTRNLAASVRAVPKDERGGWFWRCGHGTAYPGWAHLNRVHPDHCDKGDEITAYAKTPALALCIAALRARQASHD